MATVLFACYHQQEMGTVLPVAKRLASMGHASHVLALVNTRAKFNFPFGEVFRLPVLPTGDRASLTASLHGHILGRLDPEARRRMDALLFRLEPHLTNVFPLLPAEWATPWQSFVEEVLESARPDAVVLSLGQFETPLVRLACRNRGIPCIYQLVPFYEFKDVERLPIAGGAYEDDEFIVAGPYGVKRLHDAGVSRRQIVVTGAPLFEDALAAAVGVRRCHASACRIICAEQSYSENARLRQHLLAFVAERPHTELVIRPHPAAMRKAWTSVWDEIRRYDVGSRVDVSERASSIIDELRTASVLVTISSLAICEAILLDVPVICWWPSFLPPESPLIGASGTYVARTVRELNCALDRHTPAEPHATKLRSSIVHTDVHKSPSQAICERILARCGERH